MGARDTQVGGDHYQQSRYQPWDVLPEWLEGWPPFQAYLVGNIVKYLYRAKRKGVTITDLRKAQHYLAHLIELVEADLEPRKDAVSADPGDQFP